MKYRRTVRVRYPLTAGTLLLRSQNDWNRDLEADRVDEGGSLFTFTVEADQPFLYVKPCLRVRKELHWASGANTLVLMFEPDLRVDHPYFFPDTKASPFQPIGSTLVYLPPGYHENHLARFRVIYLLDDPQLFFPSSGTLELLAQMNAVDSFLVVSATSDANLVGELKPLIDRSLRTHPGKADTAVMGISQGGVAAFSAAWQNPDVFVAAICMSSPFTQRDNLLERVYSEPPRSVAFYLDSGGPRDHYEATLAMATALVQRGWQLGRDLVHLSHAEQTPWATRLHIPCQMFARSLRDVNLQQHGSQISPGLT